MQAHQLVPKVLIVGCGDLGCLVATQLSTAGFETFGLRRKNIPIDGVHMIQADVTQAAGLDALKQLQTEILIYCVAANGQTDEQYKAHYVDGLRNILMAQVDNPHLKHVFFVSSTRVYGQQTDAILDESTPALAADFGGERLLEAEALLKDLACNSTALRPIWHLWPGRLRMINLAKSPQSWPAQDGWTNRIHRDDAAAFIVFLVQKVWLTKLSHLVILLLTLNLASNMKCSVG